MKFNKWTLGLAAIGVVSLASAARADEKMSQLQTALSNTTISGYVDTAAQWNPGTDQKPAGGPNIPAYSFAKDDGFTLNAIDIAIDHPEDETPWAAGYHVELMAGPDAVPTATVGGVGIRQAYLSLRTPIGNSGIDWKVGVWDTIIGYESSSDPSNPNYTRSYGYSIEPTTHTGVQGNYKVNDEISVQAGVADGSNLGTSPAAINGTSAIESQKAYMGAVALTAPSSWGWASGATLNAGIIDSEYTTPFVPAVVGPPAIPAVPSAHTGTTSYYAGATIPTPMSALKGGVSFDYADAHDHAGAADVVGLYASYQFNPNTSFNLRGEWGQNDDPTLLANTVTGFRNTFEEATATLQYNLWANVLTRAEVRWDHIEHGDAYGAGPSGGAFRNNDFLLALNLIYQF